MQSSVSPDSQPHKSLLGEYLAFLKAPTDVRSPDSVRDIFIKIWRLYTVHLLLLIPMGVLIQLLSKWVVSIGENKLGAVLESIPPSQFIFLAVVFAPLTEELLFRLPLRFSVFNLALPLTLILIVGARSMTSFGYGAAAEGLTWVLVAGLAGLAYWYFWPNARKGKGTLNQRLRQLDSQGKRWWARHLRLLVYGSSVLFGLVHIANYPQQAWIVTPLLVLPQTTLGLLLAYVRIRFGFFWAIFTHGLHNFLATSPILVMVFGSERLKQMLLQQATDVDLFPKDQVLMGLFGLWILVIFSVVVMTAARLIWEWKQDWTAPSH